MVVPKGIQAGYFWKISHKSEVDLIASGNESIVVIDDEPATIWFSESWVFVCLFVYQGGGGREAGKSE